MSELLVDVEQLTRRNTLDSVGHDRKSVRAKNRRNGAGRLRAGEGRAIAPGGRCIRHECHAQKVPASRLRSHSLGHRRAHARPIATLPSRDRTPRPSR